MEVLVTAGAVAADDSGRPLPEEARWHGGGVLLRLGAARYAVPMADVAEVIHVPATTRVPGAPGWLVGVANWRGHVLPILDLRPLLGAEAVPPTTSARVVVISVDDVEAGVLADQVPGPLAEQEWERSPVPATASAAAADLLAGAVLDDQGPVCLLDVAGLVALGASLAGR